MSADPYVRALNISRVYLVKNITDVESILDHLKEILSNDHYETIRAERTESNKVRMLLDILAKRTPRETVFNAFCTALAEQGECVNVLRSNLSNVVAQTSAMQTTSEATVSAVNVSAAGLGIVQAASMVPMEQEWLVPADETRMVKEENLADVCSSVGNIDMLRIYLGFSEAHLAQVRMANPYYPANQVLKLLCDWRSKHYHNATVKKLVEILRRCGVADSTLQRVFQQR